jgi:TonB family protein
MKPTHLILLAAVVVMALARTAGAQSPRPVRPPERALPNGMEIDARDGDRIIVEGDARVRVITRYRGFVRAVYNTEQRWLILMIDSSSPDTGAPDGKPDHSLTYNGLEGDWPLGERWEGYATVDQYTLPAAFRPNGVGIATPEGLVQIFPYSPIPPNPSAVDIFRDASARAVLTHRGSGTGNSGGVTFDQMEKGMIASAMRNAQMQLQMQQQNLRSNTSSWSASGGQASGAQGSAAGGLRKIVDVPAKYPDAARQSRVMGVVILELTVQPDGTVSNARVLRSIPSLDAAALEAVRQWRYEPTGLPNAVNMTVTVNFAPQR